MIVFVDGYNVIKFLLPHNRHEHDAQRAWLVAEMGAYRRAKGNSLKDVVVVFDGGMFGHCQREVVKGVAVVFAGRGRCADSVLIEYAQKYGNQAVVVTNDRELQHQCKQHHASVMGVDPFFDLVEEVAEAREAMYEERFGDVVVAKLVEEGQDEDPELDRLMVAGSMAGVYKPCDDDDEPKKETSKGKKSKAARAAQRLKKRLG